MREKDQYVMSNERKRRRDVNRRVSRAAAMRPILGKLLDKSMITHGMKNWLTPVDSIDTLAEPVSAHVLIVHQNQVSAREKLIFLESACMPLMPRQWRNVERQ